MGFLGLRLRQFEPTVHCGKIMAGRCESDGCSVLSASGGLDYSGGGSIRGQFDP
jgi:hypothetical protein